MNTTELQLTRFSEFLLHRQLVREKTAPFIVRWVRMFLKDPPVREGTPINEMVLSYIEQLRADGRYESWQLRQAEQALRLYFHNFLPGQQSSNPPIRYCQSDCWNLIKFKILAKQAC